MGAGPAPGVRYSRTSPWTGTDPIRSDPVSRSPYHVLSGYEKLKKDLKRYIGTRGIRKLTHEVVGMPDVSRTEIGQRIYQLTKEKSAEQALEKIRAHVGARWAEFDRREIETLKRLLGQAWTCVDCTTWDRIPFQDFSYDDVRRILNTGRWSGDDLASVNRRSDEVVRILSVGV